MGKPRRKSKHDLLDEAWRRLHQADEHGNLPGQLALGENPAPAEPPPAIEGIPDACPECAHVMTPEHGWAPSVELCACGHDRDHHLSSFEDGACTSGCGCITWIAMPYTIQCGQCGKRFMVSHVAWLLLRAAIRECYMQLNAPKPAPQPKRQRGAR